MEKKKQELKSVWQSLVKIYATQINMLVRGYLGTKNINIPPIVKMISNYTRYKDIDLLTLIFTKKIEDIFFIDSKKANKLKSLKRLFKIILKGTDYLIPLNNQLFPSPFKENQEQIYFACSSCLERSVGFFTERIIKNVKRRIYFKFTSTSGGRKYYLEDNDGISFLGEGGIYLSTVEYFLRKSNTKLEEKSYVDPFIEEENWEKEHNSDCNPALICELQPTYQKNDDDFQLRARPGYFIKPRIIESNIDKEAKDKDLIQLLTIDYKSFLSKEAIPYMCFLYKLKKNIVEHVEGDDEDIDQLFTI